MRLAAPLGVTLTACWTGPVAEPETPVMKTGRCAIHETDVEISGLAELSIEGMEFASQSGPLQRLSVTFEGTRGRAKIENETFVLEGDLELSALAIRPRELALRDGWIEIRSATAKTTSAATLKLQVTLPEGLAPRTAMFGYPCHALTFAAPPEASDDETEQLATLELAVGTQLRPTPDGHPVVRVSGHDREGDQPIAVEATVLERKGAMTRVRIAGDNPVTGWVPTSALRPVSADQLGGFGFGRSGYGRAQVFCARDTPIYVRVGGRVVRVGKIKKEQGFYLGTQQAEREEEQPIDLGVAKPATVPFVKSSDFARCG